MPNRDEQVPNRDQLLDELFPPAVLTPPPPTDTPSVEEDTRELPKQSHQQLDKQGTQPQEPTPCSTLDTDAEQETLPNEIIETPFNLPIATGTPRRTTRKPNRYGHNICERIGSETGSLQPRIRIERQVNHLADINAVEKPKKSIASQLHSSQITKYDYCPWIKASAHTTCQGQIAFPVENSTHEISQAQLNNFYQLNYSSPLPPNFTTMEGKEHEDSSINPGFLLNTNNLDVGRDSTGTNNNNGANDQVDELMQVEICTTDQEAELLGADTPTDTITDVLNESLLCTPSRGVLDAEPMLNENIIPESTINSPAAPPSDKGGGMSLQTPNPTVEANELTNPVALPNNPNLLTREQAESIKHKLSELIQQASALVAVDNISSNDNDCSDIVLTGQERDVRQRQLAARPRVVISPLDAQQREQLETARQRQATQNIVTDQLIYVTDRTKQWVRDNISPNGPDKCRCKICRWDGKNGQKKRVQIHIKQHVVHMYCPCGFSKVSRDTVYDHQASHHTENHSGHGPKAGYIYQVDHASYHRWAQQVIGWSNPPSFLRPSPYPPRRRQGPSQAAVHRNDGQAPSSVRGKAGKARGQEETPSP